MVWVGIIIWAQSLIIEKSLNGTPISLAGIPAYLNKSRRGKAHFPDHDMIGQLNNHDSTSWKDSRALGVNENDQPQCCFEVGVVKPINLVENIIDVVACLATQQ